MKARHARLRVNHEELESTLKTERTTYTELRTKLEAVRSALHESQTSATTRHAELDTSRATNEELKLTSERTAKAHGDMVASLTAQLKYLQDHPVRVSWAAIRRALKRWAAVIRSSGMVVGRWNTIAKPVRGLWTRERAMADEGREMI